MNLAKHWAANLDDYVIDLAWSPDGSLLAAASAAGGITLFDASTGSVRHTLSGHTDGANCLAWLPANVAGVVDPGSSPADPTPIAPPRSGPAVAAVSPSSAANLQPSAFRLQPSFLLASGGQDGCVRFWDATSGSQTAEAKLGSAWVEHLAWGGPGLPSPDSAPPSAAQPTASVLSPVDSGLPSPVSLLYAAAGRKLVALRPDGSPVHTFPEAPKTLSALAVFRTNNPQPSTHNPATAVAVACFGQVRIFDATIFALRQEYVYGNAIYALTWSPDGRWLVAGCHDNAVHLWAPAEDLELHMSGYETRLKELSFSHDSRWLATGGGRDACVWDCSGPGPEGREPLLLPHQARVCAVAFQHAHSLLATGDTRGVFTLWSPTRKNPMFAEVTMPTAATKFAWRQDDALLAVGTEKGQVFTFRTT